MTNNQQQKGNLIPILMMIALFAMISFVTGLQNPMAIIVKSQFEASNFMSQLGNAANFIAYAVMGIPAGLLLTKIGYKKTALTAVAIGFIGVAIQYLSGQVESFAVFLIGAFVAGFSMCLLNTVVNPMLNTLGGGGKKGNQLIQIGGSLNSLAATIVPVLTGYLIGNAARASIADANPVLFIAMGVFAVVFIVLFIMDLPEPHMGAENKVEGSTIDAIKGALKYSHFVLGAIAIFVYVGVEVGVPNFVNLFMTSSAEHGGLGIDTTIAGAVVGTYWFLMLLGRLFIGATLGAKISSKAMLSGFSLLGLVFVLLAIFIPTGGDSTVYVSMPVFQSDISFGLAKVPVNVMLLVLCGLCTSVMWGGIFNLAVEGLGKYTTMASGIFMVMVCGGGILPLLQGQIADSASFISSYWVIVVGLLYLLYYALAGSKVSIPAGEKK